MSNSSLVNYTRISPNKSSRNGTKIDMVIIHCVVGQASVESLGSRFAQSSVGASSNYGIGADGRIGMYVEEKDRAWCSGGVDRNGRSIRVNGISGADIDRRAISIECASDAYAPYKINDKVYRSLIKLLVDICKRNGIVRLKWQGNKNLVGNVAQQNMAVHRWFAYKSCPGDYIYNLHPQIVREVNSKLEEMEDEDMTQEKFNELANNWLESLNQKGAANYAQDALNWGKSTGLMQGNEAGNQMPKGLLTREQFIVVLKRMYDKFIK